MEISEYIDSVPASRRERLLAIISLIKQLFPNAEESMKYKMPTYTTDTGWVAVANQKNYVSLYTCSAEHLETFKMAHPQIKTGKGCINFRDKDPISLDDLKPVICSAVNSNHEHR